jgi:hypothetical protein
MEILEFNAELGIFTGFFTARNILTILTFSKNTPLLEREDLRDFWENYFS